MSSLLVLLPWFAALIVFRGIFPDWREAALSASVVWGVIVIALTESLSIFYALAFVPLVIAWAALCCASVAVLMRFAQSEMLTGIRLANFLHRKYLMPGTLLVGLASIFLATVVVALVSPPNSWDSMTYHMARVANWVDHRSIRCYPTHILRQLFFGPWAEFAITNLQILAGSDRLANMVQYASMLGSAVGVSMISKKMRADSQGQLLAAVFCVTIPIGILEASGTQNDYVTAFWFLCFLNYILDFVNDSTPKLLRHAVMGGASLGLAILTKMTALLFAAPFLVWVSIALVRRQRVRAVSLLVVLGGTALTINAGHLVRNQSAFGSPLGPRAEIAPLLNEIHTPSAVASNVIRNLAVHLAVPKAGRYIRPVVIKVHSLTGLDVSDPRITWIGQSFDYYLSLDEFYAGNPFHLFVAGLAIIVVFWRFRANRNAAIYSMCIFGGFLLFCGDLRWQRYASRLQLPLFVALAPICGIALSRKPLRQAGYILSIFAICIGLFYATKNDTRMLIGRSNIFVRSRTDLYFASRPVLRDPFVAAAEEVGRRNAATVGIITGWNDWEYPFWLLVRTRFGMHTRFEHVNVQNESCHCASAGLTNEGLPRVIVIIGSSAPEANLPPSYELAPENAPPGYRPVFLSEEIRVFEQARDSTVTQRN